MMKEGAVFRKTMMDYEHEQRWCRFTSIAAPIAFVILTLIFGSLLYCNRGFDQNYFSNWADDGHNIFGHHNYAESNTKARPSVD